MLVSACLITYNQDKYIKECIKGAINQKVNFKYEIIIGDDCSNDKTSLICQYYASKYPNLIKYKKRIKNLGMIGNWKETISNCAGKYIALCEGDDYWIDPLKLQKQVDFLESNEDFSGCFHNTMFIDERQINSTLKPWRMYDKDIFNLEDTISTTAILHTSSFMCRSGNLNIPKWFINVQSADMALFALIASKGLLYRIDGFMSVYRKNETGITNFIKIKEYHKNRIKLNLYFKKSFDVSVHKKIDEVIKYHTSELSKMKSAFIKKLKSRIYKKVKTLIKF